MQSPLTNSLVERGCRCSFGAFRRSRPVHSRAPLLCTSQVNSHQEKDIANRRGVLQGSAALVLGSLLQIAPERSAQALPASKGQTPSVGTYLPSAGVEDFVEFVPGPKKTPALRAGTVSPDKPYRFALPPTWREAKVANIQSGNYCQPRCDEPWTEVVFEDPGEGKATLIVSPLRKLTNKANAKLDDIGTVDGIIESLGSFITGTYLDTEDVVSKNIMTLDGQLFYVYETNAPYGTAGPHAMTAVTTKGDLAFMFILSANEKQWAKSSGKLKQLVETFRA